MAASNDGSVATDERVLLLTRVFDAPRALVFQAWTAPEQIARWWGPQGFSLFSVQLDIRVGGRFRIGMRSPTGTEHWKQGIYREIVAPERIAFSFAWEDAAGQPGHETLVTVTFSEQGDKTELTLRQAVFATVAARDDHRAGWTSCMQRFADYLAATPNL
jgi:uncharacterized protein YndB with AHSA1/START domain